MFNTTQNTAPLVLSASTQSQTYGLFAAALALTLIGVGAGMQFGAYLFSSGILLLMVFAELALVFTAGWWSKASPWNYLLFVAFPLLSGITITPYLLSVINAYVNGSAILLNAVGATVFLALAAAVLARIAPGLAVWSRALFFALIGLIALSLLQIFVPALRTTGMELLISGAGIVIFGLFTAVDLQRIERMGAVGANPFMLALSLYLDIYNMFLFILRFMVAFSGDRR